LEENQAHCRSLQLQEGDAKAFVFYFAPIEMDLLLHFPTS
jgi:hypothetical protein